MAQIRIQDVIASLKRCRRCCERLPPSVHAVRKAKQRDRARSKLSSWRGQGVWWWWLIIERFTTRCVALHDLLLAGKKFELKAATTGGVIWVHAGGV
jgi:hypothetical protein